MPAPASFIHCKEGLELEFCFHPSGYTHSFGPIEKDTATRVTDVTPRWWRGQGGRMSP